MPESRIALVVSCVCVVLLAWLVWNTGSHPPAVAAQQSGADDRLSRLEQGLRTLVMKSDMLLATVAREAPQRAPAVPIEVAAGAGAASAAAAGESLQAVQRELQDLRTAVQGLADGLAAADAGGVSHSLGELQRSFPTTNWEACEALLQRARADPEALDRSQLDCHRSKVLGALRMARPADLLRQFGSPSSTGFDSFRFGAIRFLWRFDSPKLTSDGQPEYSLGFVFDKGYVFDVELRWP